MSNNWQQPKVTREQSRALATLERARVRREAAEQAWRAAIVAAVDAGVTLRRAAPAAGVTNPRIAQIVKAERGRAD